MNEIVETIVLWFEERRQRIQRYKYGELLLLKVVSNLLTFVFRRELFKILDDDNTHKQFAPKKWLTLFLQQK